MALLLEIWALLAAGYLLPNLWARTPWTLSQSPCTALTAAGLAVWAVQEDCLWPFTNRGNSHQSLEPRIHWDRGISKVIFRPTKDKKAMPCLIPHWQSYSHQTGPVKQSMTPWLVIILRWSGKGDRDEKVYRYWKKKRNPKSLLPHMRTLVQETGI